MKIDGKSWRPIWVEPDGWAVGIIDQTRLPHAFETLRIEDLDGAARAILDMQVRGAPLIGAMAAYGVCLALRANPSTASLDAACARLLATRPTAVNLRWALAQMREAISCQAAGTGDRVHWAV